MNGGRRYAGIVCTKANEYRRIFIEAKHMIAFSAILPHSPHIVPGMATKDELWAARETLEAIGELKQEFDRRDIETVVIVSPHVSHEDPYSFGVNRSRKLTGDLRRFGLKADFSFRNDLAVLDQIDYCCAANEAPVHFFEGPLDYGSLVPLFFLAPKKHIHLVHVASSFLNLSFHYTLGQLIEQAAEKAKRRIAVIASSNLSHRLQESNSSEFANPGQEFERRLLWALEQNRTETILGFGKDLVREADECGLRPIVVLLGAHRGAPFKFRVLAHEAPQGVGYLVAQLT